jgi:hypothetical protein
MTRSASNRDGRYNRDEDPKPPKRDGDGPRPSTEPDDADTTGSPRTMSDPVTGAPNPPRRKSPER